MRKIKLIWKLFSIQQNELFFVVPLLVLYFLSGAFYTIGQIYCETLFLKAYGAKGFSYFFIYNGIALIICGIFYNYFLLKISLRKGYFIIIGFSISVIILSSFFVHSGLKRLPFFLYLCNYLFTFFLDIHFFNYSFHFLNLRNSKRVLPFVMGGGKLGGIISSILIFSLLGKMFIDFGIYIWAVLAIVLVIPIIVLNKKSKTTGTFTSVQKKDILPDYRIIDRLIRKIKMTYSSSIFVFSLLAVFSMSIVNQISEYYFAYTFNAYFSTKEQFASFLSIYTFCADLVTLFAQVFLTSRIIKKTGITRANYLYPVNFIAALSVLIVYPGLIAGVLLRFYRKNFSLIIRTPVYNIILASSPKDRMAEVKSFISGIIAPLGMITGGVSIFIIFSYLTPVQGYIFTSVCVLFYLAMIRYQNKAYLNTIKNRLQYDFSGRYSQKISFDDYEDFFTDRINKKSYLSILEDIFNNTFALEAVYILYKNYTILDEITRINILKIIRNETFKYKRDVMAYALGDSSPYVRAYALALLKDFKLQERKEFIMQYYWHGKMESERYVISYLLNLDSDKKRELENADFIKENILNIKRKISNDDLKTVEFVIFANALPQEFFLPALIDLTLLKQSHLLFKNLVPYVSKIETGTVRVLIKRFIDCGLDINIFSAFIANSKGLTTDDKMYLLESLGPVPVENMELIFRYDTSGDLVPRLLDKLTSNTSYRNKDNYLKCLMVLGIRHNKRLLRFIDSEVEEMTKLSGYLYSIQFVTDVYECSIPLAVRFYSLLLNDMLELHKHLILKAISIVTGIDIDDVYESNLLLRDTELNSLIFEYIESSGKKIKQVVPFLESSNGSIENYNRNLRIDSVTTLNDIVMSVHLFLPEIEVSGTFYVPDSDGKTANRRKLDFIFSERKEIMLTLLEKVVFLKDTRLFSGLKTNELIHIAKITKEIEIEKDQVIIKKGDVGNELFIIVDGEVSILFENELVTTVDQGGCIGELSIIDNEPRSADVVTAIRSRFLVIRRNDFLLTLKNKPAILINIMMILTGRIRGNFNKV